MRPVSSTTRSRVVRASALTISKWVRASRGSSVWSDISVRSCRSRPIGASIVPVRAGGRPSTSARYSRRMWRSESSAFSAGGPRQSSPPPAAPTCHGRDGERCPRATAHRHRRRARPEPEPGSRPVAACRVHDHAGRLVDDEQVLVLVGDLVRGLGGRRLGHLLVHIDDDHFAGLERMALGRPGAVDPHPVGLDQRLCPRPRAHRPGEKAIEPRPDVGVAASSRSVVAPVASSGAATRTLQYPQQCAARRR